MHTMSRGKESAAGFSCGAAVVRNDEWRFAKLLKMT
jgi:hypothetical protein